MKNVTTIIGLVFILFGCVSKPEIKERSPLELCGQVCSNEAMKVFKSRQLKCVCSEVLS